MRYDFRNWTHSEDLPSRDKYYRTYDADTGGLLSPCIFADEETGEYERFVVRDGRFQFDPLTRRPLTEKGKCRLRIEEMT